MFPRELNTQLYKKMLAEQEKFRKWLLILPDEIPKHIYEYIIQKNIRLSLEYNNLSGKQAQVLPPLSSGRCIPGVGEA